MVTKNVNENVINCFKTQLTRIRWLLYDVLNKYQYRDEFVLNDVYYGSKYRIQYVLKKVLNV